MNYFRMRTGTVSDTTKRALKVSFNYENELHVAFAFKSVCYVGDLQSKNPHKDFTIGSRIDFSAVLDPTSWMPEVWKVVSAWTERKPLGVFEVEDWDGEVSEIYDTRWHLFQIWRRPDSPAETVQGEASDELSLSNNEDHEIEFDLSLERKALRHARRTIKESTKVYKLEDTLYLIGIFLDVGNRVLEYILESYPQLENFFLVHSAVFNMSDEGVISCTCSCRQFNDYLYKILSQVPVLCCSRESLSADIDWSINLNTESFSILFLRRMLVMYISKGNEVFTLRTEQLEQCLNDVPDVIREYIFQYYDTVSNFVEYHSAVFQISRSNKIYPREEQKTKVYITDTLPELLSTNVKAETPQVTNRNSSSSSFCSVLEDNDDPKYNSTCNLPPSLRSFHLPLFSEPLPSNSGSGDWPDSKELCYNLNEKSVSSAENIPDKVDHTPVCDHWKNDTTLKTFQEASTQTESTGPILSLARLVWN